MHVAYLLFFLSLGLYAQSKPSIQLIPNPRNVSDFDHHFRGCPENSECDQVMGQQMKRWKDLVSKLKDDELSSLKRAQLLELFRSKYGIPTEFYTSKKSQQGFKPLYYNSPCKIHNPKQEELRTLKGLSFVKSITKSKAVVWRDQTQIEVPLENLFIPQLVRVYGEKIQDYHLSLEDQPLFIKNKELYVLKEEDGFFYILRISPEGDWKIDDVDFTKLSNWEEKKQTVACPVEKTPTASPLFGIEFCKTVWDEDQKKSLVVKMHQGCAE